MVAALPGGAVEEGAAVAAPAGAASVMASVVSVWAAAMTVAVQVPAKQKDAATAAKVLAKAGAKVLAKAGAKAARPVALVPT